MGGFKERSLEELYRDDPERADALVFGRKAKSTRRGFLKGAGLTAMTAAVGGPSPLPTIFPRACCLRRWRKARRARRRPSPTSPSF